MAEESGQQATGGAADQSQGSTTEQSADQSQDQNTDQSQIGSEDTLTKEQLLKMVKQANSEAAQRKRELRAAQTKISEWEQSQLSEKEKLEARLKALEEENNTLKTSQQKALMRSEITSAATKLGFLNPSVAHRLVDEDKIKLDEDSGKVLNAEALLNELVKTDPYLVGRGSVDAAARSETTSKDMNTLIRQKAGRA